MMSLISSEEYIWREGEMRLDGHRGQEGSISRIHHLVCIVVIVVVVVVLHQATPDNVYGGINSKNEVAIATLWMDRLAGRDMAPWSAN